MLVIFFPVPNIEVFSSKIIVRIETFLLSPQTEINRGELLKTCTFILIWFPASLLLLSMPLYLLSFHLPKSD